MKKIIIATMLCFAATGCKMQSIAELTDIAKENNEIAKENKATLANLDKNQLAAVVKINELTKGTDVSFAKIAKMIEDNTKEANIAGLRTKIDGLYDNMQFSGLSESDIKILKENLSVKELEAVINLDDPKDFATQYKQVKKMLIDYANIGKLKANNSETSTGFYHKVEWLKDLLKNKADDVAPSTAKADQETALKAIFDASNPTTSTLLVNLKTAIEDDISKFASAKNAIYIKNNKLVINTDAMKDGVATLVKNSGDSTALVSLGYLTSYSTVEDAIGKAQEEIKALEDQ